MVETFWSGVPGGQALVDWFGRVPRFHDAELLEISLASNGPSVLRIHTWAMTDKVNDRGYIVLDKHVVVIITLHAVTYVSLSDFNLPGIIFDLELSSVDDELQLSWSGSYGVSGTLRATKISLELKPGKP